MPVIQYRYWLPPRTPKGKPYLSVPMTAEEAAARGLTELDPASRVERTAPGDTASLGTPGPGNDWRK